MPKVIVATEKKNNKRHVQAKIREKVFKIPQTEYEALMETLATLRLDNSTLRNQVALGRNYRSAIRQLLEGRTLIFGDINPHATVFGYHVPPEREGLSHTVVFPCWPTLVVACDEDTDLERVITELVELHIEEAPDFIYAPAIAVTNGTPYRVDIDLNTGKVICVKKIATC